MASDQSNVIGIDLGTTYSAMAYLDRHGVPVTIRNPEGELTTPSAVLFEGDGEVVVGQGARRASILTPDRVALCVKRDMGLKFYEQTVAGKRWNPSVISAFILHKLKLSAEEELGPVDGAVITVPAYFDEARRQATADAGAIAGLEVLDIVNEPTAAALAYAFKNYHDRGGNAVDLASAADAALKPATVLVYDLGGGTFDVTVLRIDGPDLTVIATEGEVRLGGTDWDERLIAFAAERFIEQFGSDPRQDPQSHQDLALLAEEAKKDLSRRESTRFAVNHDGHRLTVTLTRIEFNEMTSDLLFRTESRVDRVIRQAGLAWKDIDDVLLVGGSTRMPQVRQMLRKVTGREPNAVLAADEVVAHGAAIMAAILRAGGGKASTLKHATKPIPVPAAPAAPEAPEAEELELELEPLTGPEPAPPPEPEPELELDLDLGLEVEAIDVAPPAPDEAAGSETMAEYAAAALDRMASEQKTSEEDSAEFLKRFDEDISEALGSVTTRDVNAHSLGVIAYHPRSGREINSILIPRNTPLPASVRKVYGTVEENQKLVRVCVIEGESPDPTACTLLGECVISELPDEMPRGSRICVNFTLDESGRLHVEAREEKHGGEAHAVLIRSSTLSPGEIEDARQNISNTRIS